MIFCNVCNNLCLQLQLFLADPAAANAFDTPDFYLFENKLITEE